MNQQLGGLSSCAGRKTGLNGGVGLNAHINAAKVHSNFELLIFIGVAFNFHVTPYIIIEVYDSASESAGVPHRFDLCNACYRGLTLIIVGNSSSTNLMSTFLKVSTNNMM